MSNQVAMLEVANIQANPVALREVNRENEEFQKLVDSVRRKGILNAINVREVVDPATEETFYQIVDGLHRFTAATECGIEVVPAQILDVDESEVLEIQVMANLNKVETKPIEYTKQLQRMLSLNPTMTISELAEKISSSTTFVASRLSLLKLDKSIQELVNDGSINISNAYTLAKMPAEHQHELLDQAMTMPPNEFQPLAQARIKEIRDANNAGKDPNAKPTFTATAKLRKLGAIKAEYDEPSAGPAIVAAEDLETAVEGFAAGVAWVLSLDADTVEAAEAKWEADRQAKSQAAARRKAIREEQKRQEAADKAAKALAESGMSQEEVDAELARQAAEAEAAKAEEDESSDE